MPREYFEKGVSWEELNRRLLAHARNNDWGFYRNEKFQMAEFLRSEKKIDEALAIYFEVCYLDFNGPMNNGGSLDPSGMPAFVKPNYK